MKVKLKPSTQLSCGVSQDKEYNVLEETEKYYAIWNNNGYRVCLNKQYFDIIEETQSEPNITKLDELKEYCKTEIQTLNNEISSLGLGMERLAEKRNVYSDILGRLGDNMDKEKLLEYLKGYAQIAIDDSKNTKNVLEIRYCSGKLMVCESIIIAIERGKFDKHPCGACKDWTMTTATFCPFCGRELSK